MFYVRTSSHRSSVRRSGDSERAAAEAGVLRNFITFRGRTAGLALSAASLALVPSALLVEDVAIAPLVAIVSVGVASGLLFAVLPWHRVSPVWMSAIPAFATLQIAALAVTVSQSYEFLYLPVAIATAYAFGTRRTVIAQLGLILACLSVPLALESDAWRTSLQHVFLLAPIVAAAAALALRVREEQEAKDRAYRLFSTEVQELSSRMLGHAGHPFDPEHLPRPRAEVPAAAGVAALPDAGETPMNGSNGGRKVPQTPPFRGSPARLAFIAAAALVPAATGGLAVAGAAFERAEDPGATLGAVTVSEPAIEPVGAAPGNQAPDQPREATPVDVDALLGSSDRGPSVLPVVPTQGRSGDDRGPDRGDHGGRGHGDGGRGGRDHEGPKGSPPTTDTGATAAPPPPIVPPAEAPPPTTTAPTDEATGGGKSHGHDDTAPDGPSANTSDLDASTAPAPPSAPVPSGTRPGQGGVPPGHGGVPPGQAKGAK